MEAALKPHFFTHSKDADPDCHWCQLRSFPAHSTAPITIVNQVDDAVIPPDFRFIDNMMLGKGVEPTEDEFRSGCSCGDDADCQYTGCLCLAELEDEVEEVDAGDGDGDGDGSFHPDVATDEGGVSQATTNGPPARRVKSYAYHAHGAKKGLLRTKLLVSALPLYECHEGCSCLADCPNRVVERGRTIPLQIFRTEDRGWGVRTQEAIKKGQFVDRYVGEIITSAEADRRRDASAISQRKDVYLFALDKFTDPNSLDSRLAGPSLEVDGEFMSGPSRFINHSCEPSLRIFARVGDHADKHLHDLALFAIQDIQKGEELTFDYVDGISRDDEGGGSQQNVGEMTRCLCGSSRCRGYLW